MSYNCIGLDLSLSDTGLAVVNADEDALIHLLSIKTSTTDGSRIERSDYISTLICEVVKNFMPSLIIIEEYAFGRSTMVSALGELGGIVKRDLWKTTNVSECWMTLVSSEVKKHITGAARKGKQGKLDMISAAQTYMRRYHQEIAPLSERDFKNDNLADAIGLARTGIDKFKPES